MAKKKQKEKEPEHAPRDYAYMRMWAAHAKWSPELLIEVQERAAKERQPIDVVWFSHGDHTWMTTRDIKDSDARKALGLPALILVCPGCGSDTLECTACGAEYQIRRGLGLCKEERCLATAGALQCGLASCAKVVSFSGDGVIEIEMAGKNAVPMLFPWHERVEDATAEATEAG